MLLVFKSKMKILTIALQKNLFRIVIYKIVHHSRFENFIMIIIMLSSFKLVFDTYIDKLSPDDPLVTIFLSYLAFRSLYHPVSI